MDQKSSSSIEKQRTFIADGLNQLPEYLLYSKTFSDIPPKQGKQFTSFDCHPISELSQFIWFEDNPAPSSMRDTGYIEHHTLVN